MSVDINAIRERIASSTPGPWRFEAGGQWECGEPGCCSDYWDNHILTQEGRVVLESHMLGYEDADLIAHAPTDLAALCDEVARLTSERDEALAQARRVEALHRRVPICEGCPDGGCDRDGCEEGDSAGEWMHTDRVLYWVCDECCRLTDGSASGDDAAEWPCPTIKALQA